MGIFNSWKRFSQSTPGPMKSAEISCRPSMDFMDFIWSNQWYHVISLFYLGGLGKSTFPSIATEVCLGSIARVYEAVQKKQKQKQELSRAKRLWLNMKPGGLTEENTYILTYIYICTCHICVCKQIYMCIYIYICVCVCKYACIYVHTHICIYIYIYIHNPKLNQLPQ